MQFTPLNLVRYAHIRFRPPLALEGELPSTSFLFAYFILYFQFCEKQFRKIFQEWLNQAICKPLPLRKEIKK